jgi:hypothetical protein
VEQQRLSPWATLAPDLAGRLDQLVHSVGHLAEVVGQQQGNMRQAGAAQQVPSLQQQAAAAGLAAAQPPQAATARADERSPGSGKAQVVPALYSSSSSKAQVVQVVPALYSGKVKTVDDAVQVRCHGWRWNAAACTR